MKNDLLEILACPCCPEASLDLRVLNQDKDEIVSGELRCIACGETYLVQEGIPMMVPRVPGNSSENKDLRHYEVRDANITYYDSVAEVYEDEVEQAIHQNDFNQRRIDQMVKSLAEKTKKELFLDLGCGTGNVLKLGKNHFRKAMGVDISFNMLMQAKRNGLEVIQADILFLPFKPLLFDVVSIFSVLHHIYDYSAVFNQIGRVLKDGGYFYSDWDPTKKPTPNNRKISWGIYSLAQNLFSKMGALKNKLSPILKGNGTGKEPIDFMKIRPDLKEIHSKAEYHNITEKEKRGLDFPKVKNQLEFQGFGDIQAFYHQSGLSLKELSGVPLIKSKLLSFLGFNPEPFLENILILAKKKDFAEENISFEQAKGDYVRGLKDESMPIC